jgi:hypothetical protein
VAWKINRTLQKEQETTNSSVFNKLFRRLLNCSFCPPHKYENYGHGEPKKHGNKKPKYKDHK